MIDLSKYFKILLNSKTTHYVVIIFALFFIFSNSVSATTLAPIILEANILPGESKTYEIKLYNETAEDVVIDGSIEKFIPKGEGGEVAVLPFNISEPAVSWVKLPLNSILLKPGDAIVVPVIVTVPKTADIGGYYLAIMWESSSAPIMAGNQTRIVSRVGTLLLLTVDGELDNNLELVDFNLVNSTEFYNRLPIEFSTRLRNTGNVHQKPTGSIVVKDFFNKTVDIIRLNPSSGSVLPQSNRIFQSSWGEEISDGFIAQVIDQIGNFHIGRFSAAVTIDYGENDSLSSGLIYFWLVPWQLLSSLGVLVIVVILLFIKIKNQK